MASRLGTTVPRPRWPIGSCCEGVEQAGALREEVVKVREVMATDVVSVAPETPFKDVVEQLVRSDVSGLPVVDDRGEVVGIVTEADLVAKQAFRHGRPRALAVMADILSAREHHWGSKAAGWTAADVMTTDVVTCRSDEDVRTAARRLLQLGVKRMPVVDDRELVGIVSRQDLLRAFVRSDAAIAADVRRVLTTDLNRPEGHHVASSVEDGKVTLTGDVRYSWDEDAVVSMVRGVEGVIDVESHVHHREPNPKPPAMSRIFGYR
jgi:CBS domain-containing protein